MRRMFSIKQLEELAKQTIENAPSLELKSINAEEITGDSIIENMEGYSFDKSNRAGSITYDDVYCGIVKNGNKLTCVIATNITKSETLDEFRLGAFNLPEDVAEKLYPTTIGGVLLLASGQGSAVPETSYLQKNLFQYYIQKDANQIAISLVDTGYIVANVKNYVRIEFTFLLSDNLAD